MNEMSMRIEVANLVAEIQTLAYLINSNSKFCVFVNYFGHTGTISGSIASSKENYNDKLVTFDLSLPPHEWRDNEKLFLQIKLLKLRFRKILRDNNINYEGLPYSVEEIRHYKLV